MEENKEISLKIVADADNAAKVTKSLKDELREAKKIAQDLLNENKSNTQAYVDARNKVAELQDKMRDFNDELKALDPGNRFQAISGVAAGVAGGIQAAAGAMALFGKETEDVQKILQQVQGATALAQGVDQVRELGKYFDLAKIAVKDGIAQMNKLKVALVATGLGAFAIAAGLVYQNWERIKKAIDDTFPSLGGVANLFDNLKKVAMGTLNSIVEGFKVMGEVLTNVFTLEFGKAVDVAKTFGSRVSQAYTEGYKEEEKQQAMEREAALIESQMKAHERQIKLLEAQGKETYALRKKQLEDELRLIEIQKGKETDEYKDKYLDLQILEIEHQKKLAEIREKAEEERRKVQDKLDSDYQEALNKRKELDKQAEAIKEEERKKADEKFLKDLEETQKVKKLREDYYRQEDLKLNAENFEYRRAEAKDRLDKILNDEKSSLEERLKAQIEYDEALKAIETDQKGRKSKDAEDIFKIAQGLNDALLGLGNTFIKDQKKLEEFNKKAALIQIGIDTAKAISSAVAASNGNPLNLITGGLAGYAQLATMLGSIFLNMSKAKQILSSAGSSTTPSLSSTSPTPSFSSNGFSASAPNIGGGTQPGAVVQGQRVANQTGEGANQMGQFKVYVTESDITDTQQRINTIRNKATIK